MRALLLPVRRDQYAVALTAVHAVLEPAGLTPVPGAPQALLGLVNVRGQIVPVLDTAALLGLAPLPPDGVPGTIAVVRTSRGLAALTSTGLPRAEELGEELGTSRLPTALGLHRVPDGVATLLDVEATLAPERVGG